MSLKHSLLVTCAVLATTATARSQTASAVPPTGQMLLASFDGLAKPVGARPARPVKVEVSPFTLDLPKQPVPVADGDPAQHADEIDLSALRYFASQNDLGRVSAEIRLLRSKHPDWEPPQDLFSEGGSGVDEQPLWDLFAKHDLAGIHARMDQIRVDKPEWQPTQTFAQKLVLAEAHDSLVRASDAHQWGSVIETAAANGSLLTCDDVDALWRTSEALVRTGDEARAVAAYRYVLATCKPSDVRIATVQKASLLLASPDALENVLQMGKPMPDGHGEFDQVRLDILRSKIGAAAADPSAPPPAPQDLDAVAASASRPSGQADAQLLGWYTRARKDYPAAERWFRTSLAAGPNAKAAEGLVLTLRDAGHVEEARTLSLQYADLDPLNRKLMVDLQTSSLDDAKAPPLSHDDVARLGQAIDALQSSDSAQALAWHLYKSKDVAGAEDWFRKSEQWKENGSATIGLIVTAQRLRHDRDAAARIAQYRDVYPEVAVLAASMHAAPPSRHPGKVASITSHSGLKTSHSGLARSASRTRSDGGWDQSADAIVKAYEGGQYGAAMSMLEQRRQKAAEPRGLSVVRAWALYHSGDWEGAKQVFSSLDAGRYSQERQEGLRVIQDAYTPPHMR